MVNTQSDLRREIPFEGSNPLVVAMPDTDTFQQLQNHIAKMKRRHEEELRKLKADHNQLEARFRSPQDDEHSVHTLPKRTHGESYARRTINTQDDPSDGSLLVELLWRLDL